MRRALARHSVLCAHRSFALRSVKKKSGFLSTFQTDDETRCCCAIDFLKNDDLSLFFCTREGIVFGRREILRVSLCMMCGEVMISFPPHLSRDSSHEKRNTEH